MTDGQLDRAILAEVEERWYKVARVVTNATARLAPDLTEDEHGYDVVHRRIIELVAAGRLDAQGDLPIPRGSEVRLPAQKAGSRQRHLRISVSHRTRSARRA